MQRGGRAMMRLDWRQFDSAVTVISNRIVGKGYAALYGVPRGGLVLACALSNRLKIPMMVADEMNVRLNSKVLVVDDIADHGVTIERLRKKFGPLDAAVWVRRDRAAHLTALEYTMMVSDDEWILFPWETPDNAADDEARFRDARRPASGVRAPGK